MRIALVGLVLVACSPVSTPSDGGAGDGGVADAHYDDACGRAHIECGGACVVPLLDRNHCGGCDIACTSSQICNMGVCE
jgi:hypothetical protein